MKGIKGLTVIVAAGLLASSCDLLKDVDYEVTPDPLEMHGGKVKVKAEVTLPEKGLNKQAYVEINPELGGHALKPLTIVGEKATANGKVIPFKAGGKVVYEDEIDYSPDMEAADLTVSGTIYKKGKEKGKVESAKIADGTIVTPLLVEKDFKVVTAKDQFERVTEETQEVVINYLKGSPVVRQNQLVKSEMKEMEEFLMLAQDNPKIEITNIQIDAFASLEGEEDRNNTLSANRADNARDAMIRVANKRTIKNQMLQDEVNYFVKGNGEDYVGFKETVEASDMDRGDKDRIYRILEMQSSSAAREQAIRDLSNFLFLDKNIFPEQRRAEVIVNYKLRGFSDEELQTLSQTNIDTLNLEEILFTATLTDDLDEKMRLYKAAEEKYTNDYRPANNVGVIYFLKNDLNQAKAQFEKANGIEENADSFNNLAAIAGVNGDNDTAKELLSKAEGAGEEVAYNKGVINIQDGEYDAAISNLGEDASFNKALAQLLNQEESTAKSTIDESDAAETAKGYYLKAILAAHNDNLTEIVSNLKEAIAKDNSLKSKAAKDREFMKYLENAAFTAIVK